MSQLAYSVNMAVAQAGAKYDISPMQDVMSKHNPVDEILLGVAVVKSSEDDDAIKLPAASTDITVAGRCLGVAIRKMDMASALSSPSVYPVKSSVPVMKKGRVWVKVEEAVAPNDPVYVRFAAGTGTQKGAFRASADTATAALLAGAKYLTTAAADGLAVIELDLL